MSASASRVWMTSGRSSSRASAIWPRKTRFGDLGRRVIVVVVEARLADADAFGMGGEAPHGGEVARRLSRRLVRMRADGEIDVVVSLRDLDQPLSRLDPRADGDHALDARRARARDDRVEFVGEVGKVEMAVAVDQPHGAGASGST